MSAYDAENELMKIKYELPVGYYFPINWLGAANHG
jgi:hypothetical protein